MGLTINSETSKQFLLEEDGIKGFKKAVDNNQILLAMKVLTEIIDTFMEAFDFLIESEDDSVIEEVVEPKVEKEKKSTAKKVESKEEKIQTEQK